MALDNQRRILLKRKNWRDKSRPTRRSLGNTLADALLPDFGSDAGGPGFQNLQFFGLTNAVAFSTVSLTFSNDSVDLTGSGFLDNLQYGALSASEIPLPAALPLFLVGIAGLGGFARRRRQRA